MAKAKKKTSKNSVEKSATKKKTAPKTSPKKVSKTKPKESGAFMKPLNISEELAEVIGPKAIPRTEVVKCLWKYIKKHNLQDPKNKRNINADDKLKAVFGKSSVNMFEMTKLISKHLS